FVRHLLLGTISDGALAIERRPAIAHTSEQIISAAHICERAIHAGKGSGLGILCGCRRAHCDVLGISIVALREFSVGIAHSRSYLIGDFSLADPALHLLGSGPKGLRLRD